MFGALPVAQSFISRCPLDRPSVLRAVSPESESNSQRRTTTEVGNVSRQYGACIHKSDTNAPFSQLLFSVIPSLNSFARRLCGHVDMAEDLVQEALMKAWAAQSSYQSNTNFQAWIFAILRNHYFSWRRKRTWMVPWDDEVAEHLLISEPAQMGHLELADLACALSTLPTQQQEALILVGVGGCTYDEAAHIVSCAVGTIKSRVTRGRKALRVYMETHHKLAPQSPSNGIEASAWIVGELHKLTPNKHHQSMPAFL